MNVIIPGYVPMIGRYLHVYLFIRIEGKWREIHQFTGGLCP